MTCFDAVHDPSEKPGLDRKSYRVHFDDNSGLAHALRLIQESTPDALNFLYMENHESFWKSFSDPAFKPTSMVNFSSGWTLTGTNYLEWAKYEKLNPRKFQTEVRLNFVPFVPHKYLEAECRARAHLVDSISGLSMLGSLATQLKGNQTCHKAVDSISRHYLSLLSDSSLRWFSAKTDVRKIILQGSQVPQALDLLQSNVWEPTIFSASAMKKLLENDVPRIGVDKRLQIKEETSLYYKNNPKRVFASKLGKKIKTASNNATQFFLRQHSPIRFEDSTNNTSESFNKHKRVQNNKNWGGYTNKAGKAHQNKKGGNYNKNKSWNNPKQNNKNSKNFNKNNKGNKSNQQ